MHTQQLLLKLRIQWFKLNAKDFVKRYQNGLIAIVFLLPGVAIGDNFYLLFKGLSSPLIKISDSQTPFINKFVLLLVLQSIFVVFCRAQKNAITGGKFATYLQSLPILESDKNKINIWLIMLSNHLLWVIILASFYFQFQDSVNYLSLFSNVLLVLFLLTAQYVSIFKINLKFISTLALINVLFILSIPESFALAWLVLNYIAWFVFVLQLSKPERVNNIAKAQSTPLFPGLKSSFYYQILFKATTTSTLFRLLIIVLLTIGFTLISGNLSGSNEGKLFPYSIAFEALLAYYLSGFYVSFEDQRQTMKDILNSLPVPKGFWFKRDFLVVLLLSLTAHFLLHVLLPYNYNIKELIYLLGYFVVLLLICYPIRIFVKNHQTSLTLVVLIIITAITLFNIS